MKRSPPPILTNYFHSHDFKQSIFITVMRLLSDERIKFNLENLQTPTTHEQIETIVKKAREEGKKVRVLGAGHSWSHIAQTPDIMISLHDYTGIEWDKKDPLKVTVKAGTPLRMLSQLLEEKHLAMINLGSVAAQSLAGAISTGRSVNRALQIQRGWGGGGGGGSRPPFGNTKSRWLNPPPPPPPPPPWTPLLKFLGLSPV